MAKVTSDLLDNEEEQVKQPDYTPQEIEYLKGLRERMQDAKTARDQSHEEFDGMDYVTYYEANERLANTFVKPKENKEDTNFQSGMVRQKVFSLLSALVNLDLSGDIAAYDVDGFEVQAFGDAMEVIRDKTNELDGDDEKKLTRHYELLKHGTVFVEELWEENNKKVKKSSKKFDGQVKNFKITEQIKKDLAYPCRNIIPGINVYLGDISQYHLEKQPYLFTVDVIPMSRARRMFEKWERWEHVARTLSQFESSDKIGLFNYAWTLLQKKEGYVEIVRYQDKPNNEFALLLNGVLMTPIGLGLSDLWGYEDYNIAQQNLEPIHAKFAYGKSLVARTKNKVALLDEMMRLAILKTQKSFLPPYLNLSGRVISKRVFFPGQISHGIPPNSLMPVSEKETQGVTTSELSMIQELQESINAETTSPTFSGQQAQGDPTATEIIELQRQAKMVLGLTVFAVSTLEWKLEWLRLKNLLAHWFSPEDQVVDQARELLKNKYRKVSMNQPVENEGMGLRMIIPTEQVPEGTAIMAAEDMMTDQYGMPVRMTFIRPEDITNAKLMWQIMIKPKEKKTSEVNKLMFRSFMQDIMPLMPNMSYVREKAASVWEENPQKLFAPDESMMQPMGMEGEDSPLQPPSPADMASKQLDMAMKTGA